jgi:hypothetical protein
MQIDTCDWESHRKSKALLNEDREARRGKPTHELNTAYSTGQLGTSMNQGFKGDKYCVKFSECSFSFIKTTESKPSSSEFSSS